MPHAQPLPVAAITSCTARCSPGSVRARSENPVCGAFTSAAADVSTVNSARQRGGSRAPTANAATRTMIGDHAAGAIRNVLKLQLARSPHGQNGARGILGVCRVAAVGGWSWMGRVAEGAGFIVSEGAERRDAERALNSEPGE